MSFQPVDAPNFKFGFERAHRTFKFWLRVDGEESFHLCCVGTLPSEDMPLRPALEYGLGILHVQSRNLPWMSNTSQSGQVVLKVVDSQGDQGAFAVAIRKVFDEYKMVPVGVITARHSA